jgi:hypothetical protein
MNRRILLLNLILLALLVWSGTELRRRWIEARRHEAEVLAKAPAPLPVVPPPSPAPVAPVTAADYINVAQRTLFSEDRNPNVVIEVEPPKPEPPVPPMPVYHGQMSLGTPVILLSAEGSPQKGYAAGDDIGEFKILAFDRERITFGWNGKELERELASLIPKEPAPARNTSNVNAAPAANQKGAAVPRASATSRPAPTAASNANKAPSPASARGKANPAFGQSLGTNYACLPSDTSPAGTVLDGYKKVVIQSLMGECYWEPVK